MRDLVDQPKTQQDTVLTGPAFEVERKRQRDFEEAVEK
jgi:hypothetical protein